MKNFTATNMGAPEGDMVAMLSREEDVVDMYLSNVYISDSEVVSPAREVDNPAENPAGATATLGAAMRPQPTAIADDLDEDDDDDLEDDDLDLDDDEELADDDLDDVDVDDDLDDDDLDFEDDDEDDDEEI